MLSGKLYSAKEGSERLRLAGSVPSRNLRGQALFQIPGMTPSLLNLPAGCAFRERCPRADTACLHTPELKILASGREVRCVHPLDIAPVN